MADRSKRGKAQARFGNIEYVTAVIPKDLNETKFGEVFSLLCTAFLKDVQDISPVLRRGLRAAGGIAEQWAWGRIKTRPKANTTLFYLDSDDLKMVLRGNSSRGPKIWLGGLDSNQDTQSQSLVSYQLDDLPADGVTTKTNRSRYPMIGTATIHLY